MLPADLPARYWVARANVPPALLGRSMGPQTALLIEGAHIEAVEPTPIGDAPVFDLGGATVWSAFVDPHTHLDKGDLLATGLAPERELMRAIETVEADYARWTRDELEARIGFALRTAYAHGTRALNSYCDWSTPDGPPAWQILREMRERWAGKVDLVLTSLIRIDALTDRDAADRLGCALAEARGVLGLFVYPGADVEQGLPAAFDLAERHDLALDFHIDEHSHVPVAHCRAVANFARERGWGARTVFGHACALSILPAAECDAALDAMAAAGVGLVALPATNLYLQDSGSRAPYRTPRLRGIAPVHEARARGIDVAFASDNHRDLFFPGGDLDPLQTLALATLVAQLDAPVARWSDTITTTPARRLGLAWDGRLVPGAPADLVIHPGRHDAEVMARAPHGRIVLRAGRRIDTTLPDLRELDGLRDPR
jgi:cytosine deaminase